ncbi:hypothetical protein SLS60_000739 [Paraconiothyrium brasiliense]|uniref:Uncharacterized protein n=1 Tax=Paraconiothyrium brasiliense TaxID=300254 RepID=A0ABR3S735_9PLEO
MASNNGTAGTSSFVDSPTPSSPASPEPSAAQSSPSQPSSSQSQPSLVPTSPSAAPSTAEPSASPSSSAAPSQLSSQLPLSSDPVTEPSSAPTSEPPASSPVSLPTSEPPTSTEQPQSTEATQSSAPEPSSTEASASSAPPSSAASSSNPQDTTATVTAKPTPTSTQVVTSVVTPSATRPDETPTPITVVQTIVKSNTPDPTTNAASPTSSGTASTDPASLVNPQNKHETGGLSPAGKTAIAVVIPVVVVALLLLAGIWFWRKRKSKKSAEEARRKEVEEYGFNPNEDPTLPAVGMQSEMAEDQSGYRGWGNTTTSSNRKASTTLTSGMTYSDSNSNPGDVFANPGSPTHAYSDAHSGDPLVNGRRETMDSDGIGALGAAPAASQNQAGVHRGPSNASSSYSAADRSDNSGDYPLPTNNPQEYYDNNGGYYPSSGPYDNSYGGNQQPIIRDVSARRNTRIENPSVFPQQGNSGIAQNF